MQRLLLFLVLAGFPIVTSAEIRFKPVEYKQGEAVLEGLSAYDDALRGRRPAVLIVHQWKGLSDYEKKRAEMLAKMGYNVFAVDIYGKGIRPKDPKAAAAESAKYKENRSLLRARVRAGLEVLKNDSLTNPSKMAAIG